MTPVPVTGRGIINTLAVVVGLALLFGGGIVALYRRFRGKA
jgi:LPXTG-motif cell wall-anchored protein